MKKCCLMAVAVMVMGIVGSSAEELVIQSFEANGTITFNAISNATAYQVVEEIGGVWSNSFSVPASGIGTVTATVSMVDQSKLYGVEATVSDPAPVGMVLIPGGANSGTNPLAAGESYDPFAPGSYPATYMLTVESFYMDRYEVTLALWEEVKNWNGGNGYELSGVGSGKAADHPVHSVNWYGCVKWCNARSEKEGRTPVYYTDAGLTQVYKTGQVLEPYVKASANGYRLPTEEQWEYAARGGVSGRRFPWGEDTIQHDRANYISSTSYSYDTSATRGFHPDWDDDPQPYTSPVGTFEAGKNGYGLYDMAGNVWEWCYNWVPGYEGSFRVYRGGGWPDYAGDCRVGFRSDSYPGGSLDRLGFRAVLSPGQP